LLEQCLLLCELLYLIRFFFFLENPYHIVQKTCSFWTLKLTVSVQCCLDLHAPAKNVLNATQNSRLATQNKIYSKKRMVRNLKSNNYVYDR
jgi:hypothetical protein